MRYTHGNFSNLFFIFFICFSFIGCAQKKKITQTINYYKPYCGGARPTAEMEKDAQTPKPYNNKMVVFVSNTGQVDSIKTNPAGQISIKLKPGIYKFYESWRFYKKTPDYSDSIRFEMDCLKQEWAKEFRVLTVTKKKVSVEEKQTITEFCDYDLPCFIPNFKPPKRQ